MTSSRFSAHFWAALVGVWRHCLHSCRQNFLKVRVSSIIWPSQARPASSVSYLNIEPFRCHSKPGPVKTSYSLWVWWVSSAIMCRYLSIRLFRPCKALWEVPFHQPAINVTLWIALASKPILRTGQNAFNISFLIAIDVPAILDCWGRNAIGWERHAASSQP